MKKYSIFENFAGEAAKCCEVNALEFKEMSSYVQTTSSKSYKKDCCRSLPFG